MDRPTTGDPRGTLLWADRWAASLSHDPEAVLELVDMLSDADTEHTDDCLTLVSRILDEARMNHENEEPGASDGRATRDASGTCALAKRHIENGKKKADDGSNARTGRDDGTPD